MSAMARRLSDPERLADLAALGGLLGPVETVRRSRLEAGASLTGNRLERIEARLAGGRTRRLVLKRIQPAESWIARRTGDAAGREARLLDEPALAPCWEVFDCPYLAYAQRAGEIGLLMDDLSADLAPVGTAPLDAASEDRLIAALAALHARFWERPGHAPARALGWAVQPRQRFGLFHPDDLDEPAPVFELARRGWAEARRRLPSRQAELLGRPPAELARLGEELPWTLMHGDCKFANFAWRPDGRVAAFDWEGVAVGPAALELGYYLAINAARLPRSKEAVLASYRRRLAAALGEPVGDARWERTEALAVLAGANLLLWQKALPLLEPAPSAAAVAEWEWWLAALERWW
jgi:hypothetical protein